MSFPPFLILLKSKLLSPVKVPSTAAAYRSGSGNGDRRGAITEWAGRSGREELICAACVAIGTNHMGGKGVSAHAELAESQLCKIKGRII